MLPFEFHDLPASGGDVFSRGSCGLAGTALGFMNLSEGTKVRFSELVELMLGLRDLLPLNTTGMSSTLTSCPGSIGHCVVDGSAELWNSMSSSSR